MGEGYLQGPQGKSNQWPRVGGERATTGWRITEGQIPFGTAVRIRRTLRIQNRPLFKYFRITHLNCGRSRDALNELTIIRAQEDVLLITEVLT